MRTNAKLISPRPLLVGLTGGIASGKTTASHILRQMRVAVICADALAHTLVKPGQSAYTNIVRIFGKTILTRKKTIDRVRLGDIVFADPKKRKLLEEIVHPRVQTAMLQQIKALHKKGRRWIVLDIPLLFETGFDELCDVVWCVYATQTQQIQRMVKRNSISVKQAKQRLKAQMPLKEKCQRADCVLQNTKSLKSLRQQIEKAKKAIEFCL